MELNEYQRRANLTDQRAGDDDQALMFPLMGLASEIGSLPHIRMPPRLALVSVAAVLRANMGNTTILMGHADSRA